MGQPIIHPQKLLLLMPVNYSIAMRPNPQDPESTGSGATEEGLRAGPNA